MFGFGKQKKDAYQESQQEEYYYDEYDEGYEDDYGYDTYPEEEYDRPAENYSEYDRRERRERRRPNPPAEDRYEDRYGSRYEEEKSAQPIAEESRGRQESPLQQEVERLEETVAQLKHQLEVKQTEMSNMATTLTEKNQALEDQNAEKEQQLQEAQTENEQKLQDLQTEVDQQIQEFQTEKEQQLQKLQKEKDQQLQEVRTKKDQQITELQQQVDQLKAQLKDTQKNQTEALVKAQREIEELKRTKTENDEMKAELTNILIETKKQERAILERAEYEAKGIRGQAEQEAHQVIHDASLELRVMKQEIRNYRKRLRSVQEETAQVFVRLLANSDTLLDDE